VEEFSLLLNSVSDFIVNINAINDKIDAKENNRTISMRTKRNSFGGLYSKLFGSKKINGRMTPPLKIKLRKDNPLTNLYFFLCNAKIPLIKIKIPIIQGDDRIF